MQENQALNIALDPLSVTDLVHLSNYGFGTELSIESCPLLVGDAMLLFGGYKKQTQVSVVHPGGLMMIQVLPFHFMRGSCHYQNGIVYLCFHLHEPTICHKRYNV